MKPSNQNKIQSNLKTRKNSKDREKRKSQGNIEVNSHTENKSPESNARLYAGIDGDSVLNYAEQTAIEHLSEDLINNLTEDINYRLRYIINDSLIKARLSGRNAISSKDIDLTFNNLKLEKAYGAPTHPNWVQFSHQNQHFLCLEESTVNLMELAESEEVYFQNGESQTTIKWMPEQDVGKALKNYYSTMCQLMVGPDLEARNKALANIAKNNRIGPIIEWFYNFGYILLSKDITYDCLTLRALDLITTLEKSTSCRVHVSEKLLKLLVRLILQRLLKSTTSSAILKPICNALALLCIREPLKQFVIVKILQKFHELFEANHALEILCISTSIGIDAVQSIVLPNIELFLYRADNKEQLYIHCMLELYYILLKENLLTYDLYREYEEIFGNTMLIFERQKHGFSCELDREVDVVATRCKLIRTRRKLPAGKPSKIVDICSVFDLGGPKHEKKLFEGKETQVVVGKTSLLLSVFKPKKKPRNCCDHSPWYSL